MADHIQRQNDRQSSGDADLILGDENDWDGEDDDDEDSLVSGDDDE